MLSSVSRIVCRIAAAAAACFVLHCLQHYMYAVCCCGLLAFRANPREGGATLSPLLHVSRVHPNDHWFVKTVCRG